MSPFTKKHAVILIAIAVIATVTFILSLAKPAVVYVKKNFDPVDTNTSLLPILVDTESFPVLTAQNVYAVDLDSSVVLYQKSADEPVYPASTTKMVTALVALDYYTNLDQIINTGSFKVAGSNMGLVWYENISVKNLLYGLLIHSANDAAEVLASSYQGGREAFVAAMNEKARSLYAYNSQFLNPSGLDEPGHYSTAKDMARIALQAMRNPIFAEIVGTEEWTAESIDGRFVHEFTNRNELLGHVDGVLGVKTGYTEGARENLVTYVERNDKKIVIALLGSQDRFGESEKLLEWIFSNYEWQSATAARE